MANAGTPTETHREVERKYEVDDEAAVPSFSGLAAVTGRAATVKFDLRAVYFDTADMVLAAHRMTLRRRTGGDDAGWHLKVPGKGDERTEYRAPLEENGDADPSGAVPPIELLDRVRGLVLGDELRPVGRIDTHRTVHRFLGSQPRRRPSTAGQPDAPVLFELADDRVEAASLPGGEPQAWREWEVELVDERFIADDDAGRTLLEACEDLVAAAGARPAGGPSKLARVLGDTTPAAAGLDGSSSVGDVARAYLAKHVDRLRLEDGRVRHDLDDSVHQYRVACRRLRSALGTYKALYDPVRVQSIRDRLRALGATLGVARDAEVLRDRLLARVRAEAPALVVGPVDDRLHESLQADYERGLADSDVAMTGPDYLALLDELVQLVTEPSAVGGGADRAGAALNRFLADDWRRLRKRVRRAAAATAGEEHDLALHEVRKGAKRLRYAAESATPAQGAVARDLAGAAENLQEILGDRQDGAVARAAVTRLAGEARGAGEDTFTYGRLHALEDAAAAENLSAYADALRALNRVRPEGTRKLPVPSITGAAS